MSHVTSAPNARLIIVAISALVRFARGSILVALLPLIRPLSTEKVIASFDHPVGKSTNCSTLAKVAGTIVISIAIVTIVEIMRLKSTFFIVYPPIQVRRNVQKDTTNHNNIDNYILYFF